MRKSTLTKDPSSQFLILGAAYFETGIKELDQFNFHDCINLYIPSDFDYKTRIDNFLFDKPFPG